MRRITFGLIVLLGLCVSAYFRATPAVSDPSPSASPSPTPTPTPTPYPIDFQQFWGDAGHAPIELITSYTLRDSNKEPQQCVEFRNVSGKVATQVNFDFVYDDANGVPLVEQTNDLTGTFTPPIDIANKCMDYHLGRGNVPLIFGVDIHVQYVLFADHTVWQSGDGFVKFYAKDGEKLPQSATVAPYLPYTLPSVPDAATTLPQLNAAQTQVDSGKTPIEVVRSQAVNLRGSGLAQQCVSFRNVSSKVASDVVLGFGFVEGFATPLATAQFELTGTFTPPVEIDNKCTQFYIGSPDRFGYITAVNVSVLSVTFKDGTQWLPGSAFVPTYTVNGAARL